MWSDQECIHTGDLDATTSVNALHHFYDLTEKEIQRIQRYPHPLSLMIIDIKRFQEVNTRFGYLNGDKVLQWVARHLKDLLRAVDVIGRHGGDAFILLLPETSLENAKTVANRLSEHFSKAYLEIGEEKLKLAFHTGMTEYQPGTMVDVFIQNAERALDVVKRDDVKLE